MTRAREEEVAKYRMRLEQDIHSESPATWADPNAWIVTVSNRHFEVQPKGWTVERAAAVAAGEWPCCDDEALCEGMAARVPDAEGMIECAVCHVRWQHPDAPLRAFPLRAYVHSGVALSLGSSYPFNDRWDSGQIGFVVVDPAECGDLAEATATTLVDTWNQFLSGDVWGYVVERVVTCSLGCEHAEHVDSCWGFYGEEYARQQGEEALEEARKGEVTA